MTGQSFWSRAREHTTRTAVIDETGQAVSAGVLLSTCNRIANTFLASGMEPRGVVATLLPSGVDLLAVMLAVRQVGLYLVTLNPRAGLSELKHLLLDSAPSILFVGKSCVRQQFEEYVLAEFDGEVVWIDGMGDVEERFSEFAAGASDAAPARRIAGHILSYTSGITGLPKAVLRNAADAQPEDVPGPLLRWYTACFGIDSSTPGSFLSSCPLYFSGPMNFATCALHLGRTVVIMPHWNARMALSLISRHQVSDTLVVPFQLGDMVRECRSRPGRYRLASLKAVIHGSAHCSPTLKEQALETFGDIVYECYGSTEAAGTVATPHDARTYRGTVGRPVAPHEVRVLDNNGRNCPPGVAGKVYMRILPGLEFTYKGNSTATQDSRRDGFVTVGDIGYLNDAGYLFLTGRSSEVINCRGEKVAPTAVENVASTHPRVLDVAAFGESHTADGEAVRLAIKVLPADGQDRETVAMELFELFRESLKGSEIPRSILIVDEIPRETSGKLRRKDLGSALRSQALIEFYGPADRIT